MAIINTLKSIKGNNTIINVSHNLKYTALLSDRIVVLKDGRIEGIGTHEELLKNCSEYVRLYSKVG